MHDRGVVAAVGVRYGKHLLGVAKLLEAGFRVCLFDLGAEDPEIAEDLAPQLAPQLAAMTERWPTNLAYIERLLGDWIADDLTRSAQGAEAVIAATQERFGAVNAVYLGQWWGFVDYDVAEDFISALAAHGDGELIATEADSPTYDHTLRWVDHWAGQEACASVTCVTLREPDGSLQAVSDEPLPVVGGAWPLLVAAGWQGPLTVTDADATAAEQIESGRDLLAGRRWGFRGSGGIDSGQVVIGDALAIEAALRAKDQFDYDIDFHTGQMVEPGGPVTTVYSEEGGWMPFLNREAAGRPRRQSVLVFKTDGDGAYGIAVTPPQGPIGAVRLSLDTDGFEFPEPYEEVATIDVPTGRLVISDPAYLKKKPEIELAVSPGRWVVESLTHDGELEGIRLRPEIQVPPLASV